MFGLASATTSNELRFGAEQNRKEVQSRERRIITLGTQVGATLPDADEHKQEQGIKNQTRYNETPLA